MSNQQSPNAVNLRWEAAQKRKEWKKEDAAMSHHIAYCEVHDVSFQEGEYCPISETTGEECEFAAPDVAWEEQRAEACRRLGLSP